MSILINTKIGLPKNCDDCFIECDCPYGQSIDGYYMNKGRPKNCPLIEVPEWIPVTERLPNGNGEYLVSGKGKVWVCEFMILGDVGGWCNSVMNPCVKYWMPLPKPPVLN